MKNGLLRGTVSVLMTLAAAALARAETKQLKLDIVVLSAATPTAVNITWSGGEQSVDCQQKLSQFVCSAQLSRPVGQPRTAYTLIASWPDGSEGLYLQIPLFSANLSQVVRVYHRAVDIKLTSIEAIEARGTDLLSTYQAYYEARYLYRKMRPVNPQHVLTMRAAKLWFDAAYRLHEPPNSVIAMDPEAVMAAQTYQAVNISATQGSTWIISPGYVRGMTANVKADEWRDVAFVPKLIQAGQLDEAEELNSYYVAKFQNLTSDELKVPAVHGVTHDLLENNASYISTLKNSSK
jgi:hypothetical protein